MAIARVNTPIRHPIHGLLSDIADSPRSESFTTNNRVDANSLPPDSSASGFSKPTGSK
jgi:hypothetical protein